jgi:DNA (cytosine-5)-methyltransferase 3A
MMKILSLFDGISCARVAAERAGFVVESYYASEIDKYAIQVAKKNYPDTIHLGSVTEINGFDYQGVDLLIGGSPCQDLSIAKKDRKGLDGSRSSLFWEYVRILKEVKPKYFILENVNSMPKEAKAIITEALGVEPIMINAALVSAQNRKRLFWTNIPGVTQPNDREIYLKDILESGDCDRLKSYCIDASYYKGGSLEHYLKKGTRQLVNVPQALTETRTDEAKKIRSINLKQGRDFSPRRAKELMPRTDQKANCLTSALTKEHLIIIPDKSKTIRTSGRGSGFGDKHNWDMISPIRKLTPIECERLQSLPDNYTDGISNTQRYKCLGNAFNVEVVSHIMGFIK